MPPRGSTRPSFRPAALRTPRTIAPQPGEGGRALGGSSTLLDGSSWGGKEWKEALSEHFLWSTCQFHSEPRDPNLFGKSNTQQKRSRFLKRTMVQKERTRNQPTIGMLGNQSTNHRNQSTNQRDRVCVQIGILGSKHIGPSASHGENTTPERSPLKNTPG